MVRIEDRLYGPDPTLGDFTSSVNFIHKESELKREPISGYCIYKDSNSSDLSVEHVIPLSLGGHDRFSVMADRQLNNGVASKIDSEIANDFQILFSRRDADAAGHSGRPPVPIAKSATFKGNKVQVRFGKDGLEVFDVVSRKFLARSEFAGEVISIGGINISLDAPFRFVAKTALSAGFFAYGDAFVKQVHHDEARAFMRSTDMSTLKSNVRVLDRFQPATGDDHLYMKLLIAQYPESKILLMPGRDCFGIAVGVLGQFIGFMNIPAPKHALPNSGDYELGHVITVRDGQVIRQSLRSALERLVTDLEANEPGVSSALEMENYIKSASSTAS